INQDDHGKLWHCTLTADDEPLHVVEVVNATPEPDGSYRRYFLRVPPASRTARQAVAWTFGFTNADDYLLAAQPESYLVHPAHDALVSGGFVRLTDTLSWK